MASKTNNLARVARMPEGPEKELTRTLETRIVSGNLILIYPPPPKERIFNPQGIMKNEKPDLRYVPPANEEPLFENVL